MRTKVVVTALCLAALPALAGCLGNFAANQGRRQAARSADYYVRTYAEPELVDGYSGDPEAQAEMKKSSRQARNDLADTVVRTGNERQRSRVGVNDRGYLTNER